MSVIDSSPAPVATPSPAPVSARPPLRRSNTFWRVLPLYLSVAPFYLLFAIFGLFPLCFSLYLAFHKWDGIGAMKYVGWNQFAYLLTDTYFWQAIVNTLEIWLLATLPMIGISVVLAFLLASPLVQRKGFYRVAFFLPHITSVVAIALVFGSLFSNQFGLLNALLTSLGLSRIAWLSQPWSMKIAIATMILWRSIGYHALIFMAGIQSIPVSLNEAARIDGAKSTQIFFHITLPLLRPIMLFTIVTSTISGMQVFTEPQVLLGNDGGPGRAGMTIVLYLYQQAFGSYHFGYGAAIGWGLFVVIVLFSLLNWLLVQRPGRRA
ncbi:carbohydrate ABC transporter permease [Dictyobacter vulcani]|nr:sugar ABC transporter permease [Dictyobacter vulcani]